MTAGAFDGPAGEIDRPAVDLRLDRPTPARIYDYLLGGTNNYQVDRDAADRLADIAGPGVGSATAWENRRFLQRAVGYLAQAGVDQFIDIGAGLPTQGNVHEIAQGINPGSHVIYVDNDPIVLAHGRALLTGNKTTRVVTADMREPDVILGHPAVRELIDFSRPVAVLFISVLPFVRDDEDPYGIVATFRDAVVPGSYLALSHASGDGLAPEVDSEVVELYRNVTSPLTTRPRARIERFFDGFELVEPGLVRPSQWRPDADPGPQTGVLYGGVGRKQG